MVQTDLEQVIAIDQRSFTLPWPASSFDYELHHNEASRCWVAELESEDNRKVVAMAVIWFIIDEAHIATIAVDPDYRSRGIGQKLLAAVLKDAAESGAKLAFLEVRRSNTAARAMYRKFGFQEVGVRPHYYGDNFEDAIMMNLDPIDEALLEELD
jgi:ribosomal-protein-alanine N-acetyltransferase